MWQNKCQLFLHISILSYFWDISKNIISHLSMNFSNLRLGTNKNKFNLFSVFIPYSAMFWLARYVSLSINEYSSFLSHHHSPIFKNWWLFMYQLLAKRSVFKLYKKVKRFKTDKLGKRYKLPPGMWRQKNKHKIVPFPINHIGINSIPIWAVWWHFVQKK